MVESPSKITFRIAVQTISAANAREHWAKKASRVATERSAVWATWIQALRPTVKPPATVDLTRIGPKALDDDNLRGALKGVRDEIALRVLKVDDADPRVVWNYHQHLRGGRKEYGVLVEVAPLSVPDPSMICQALRSGRACSRLATWTRDGRPVCPLHKKQKTVTFQEDTDDRRCP